VVGQDPADVINQLIFNGWWGLFPIKGGTPPGKKGGAPVSNSVAAKNAAFMGDK
jgi:hypothetical protein